MTTACREKGLHVFTADSQTLDITNYQAVRKFLDENSCDLLINCAAYNAVDLAEKNWQQAFRVNGLGVRNLVRAINDIGGSLVHYSSDYVFDGRSGRPYTVADTPSPINRYGESKLLGEQYVRDLADSYYLIRVSWVFGPGKINFVRKVLEWSVNRSELHIVNDQVASPTYTMDLANATLDLVESGMQGIHHLTNSGFCSRFEWASKILSLLRWSGNLVPVSSEEFWTPARRPRFSVLDNFGSAELLGRRLPDWEDATARYLIRIGQKIIMTE
jgi:dTDP-4-dehydrorhamnose reductase